tara:strand:- start:14122 stop:16512 length:2391 start_codon:yes stop_codon:yes gene_type:complete
MGLLSHGFGGGAEAADPVVERGLRFEDGDTAHMTLTPTADGDRTKGTWSFWVKRVKLGSSWTGIFNDNSGSNYMVFTANDRLQVTLYGENTDNYLQIKTTAKFRDTSSWYHFVLQWDSTDSSFSLWVNGTLYNGGWELYHVGWYGSPNGDVFGWGTSGEIIYIGRGNSTTYHGDYVLADFYYLDGTLKSASDFAETNSNGQWVPKETSFTSSEYGTAGVHLDFAGGHDSEFLLQSDHPDGSENFEDSSGAGHYVETVSGVTHQDTVGTPFGSGSAVYFDGSSYLQIARNSDEWTFGTGDFTVECWVYCTDIDADTSGDGYSFQSIAGITEGSTAGIYHPAWNLRMNNGALQWYRYDGTETVYTSQSSVITENTWHHVAVTRDGDEFKFFVDGVDESGTGGHEDNIDYTLTNTGTQDLFMGRFVYGTGGNNTDYLNGYIFDLRITKGEARDVTASGYLDAPFESTAVIHPGGDSSGKRNHYDVVNIAYGDVVRDCPESGQNYCTLNPLASPVASDISEGNLKVVTSGTDRYRTLSTIRIPSSGKWYCEAYLPDSDSGWTFGISKEDKARATEWGNSNNLSGWYRTTVVNLYNSSNGAIGSGDYNHPTDNIFQIAIDADNGKVYYGKGNSWSDTSGNFASFDADNETEEISDIDEYFVCLGSINSIVARVNFGQDGSFSGTHTGTLVTGGGGEWAYAPPTGYKALKTGNLSTTSATTFSYTGNGSADGPFIYMGYRPSSVTIDTTDTYYDGDYNPNDNIDWLANGIKIRDASQKNGSGTSYSITAAPKEQDFKYGNAR